MVGTLLHVDRIDRRNYGEQDQLHREIVWHSAPAPYQYRLLQPWLVQALRKVTRAEPQSDLYRLVFLWGYGTLRFLAILTTLVAVFASLRRTWPDETAVFGPPLSRRSYRSPIATTTISRPP